ncbi:alpha/beta fold hydrolase [Massilia endophytica]|uniref:alpha/beta fold hydrolase n=1 Tax=Massilia endophytica TaxID=2899220 RepID=UPI001E32AF8D|nr:alpha/beta hydrolase [Massilia endophytica]UGQ46278.1 alpha/beta hydrolase [Massilia endophytica]
MYRRDFLKTAGGVLSAALMVNVAGAAVRSLSAADYHATRRFADTGFGRIAYVERGSGDAALFLHGFPLSSFQWRGVLERLAPHRRCIAPDFMAAGFTEVAEGQSVIPRAQAAMLIALLDKLGIAKADIVANDSGGAVAQLLLVHYPERVRSVILTNCDSEINCPPQAMQVVFTLARRGAFADEMLAPCVADKNKARQPDNLGGACYANPANLTDEVIDYHLGQLVSTPSRKALVNAYALGLEPNILHGVGPALKKSRIPVRILWGMSDTVFAPSDADFLDRAFGNSKGVLRLPESKLFWPEERPDLIASEALKLWG